MTRKRAMILVRLIPMVVGSGVVFSALTKPHGEARLRGLLIGTTLTVFAQAWAFLDDPDIFFAFMVPFVAVCDAFAIVDEASRRHGGISKNLVAVVALTIFLAPLPGLARWYTNRRDEMQRSIMSGAAAVSFVGLVMASFAYFLLGYVVDLPAVSLGVVAAIGVFMFSLTWIALRVSLAR